MTTFLRGALIEYGSGLIASFPNIVIFQFNPESLTRSMKIPERPTGANARERTQAGESTFESLSFKAHFSAADLLGEDKALARAFGIGPQLAALEKMAQPSHELGALFNAAVDAVGSAIGFTGGTATPPTQAIPRQQYPKVLFIWGLTRIQPVTIDAMRISELEYDFLLNPTRAEVDLELTVTPADGCSDDWLAKGAMAYTTMAKEAQAIANLVNTAEQIVELIPI